MSFPSDLVLLAAIPPLVPVPRPWEQAPQPLELVPRPLEQASPRPLELAPRLLIRRGLAQPPCGHPGHQIEVMFTTID